VSSEQEADRPYFFFLRTTLSSVFSPYQENLAVEGAVTWKVDVNFDQSICDDENFGCK
jgi:hypothetical protein